MECNHAHLIKVLNMNSTTYKCQDCKNLYDVTLGEVAQVEVVFGTLSEKKEQDCGVCDGTGAVDSGGFTPWGEGINIKCGHCNGTGKEPNDLP